MDGCQRVVNAHLQVRPADILLVEDNPADVRLTREALASNKLRADLHVVDNGEDALKYLRKEEGFKDKSTPDLVILDINLPRKDGLEVLKEIRQDPRMDNLAVVVLTTSDAERDVIEAYNLHVNCYVTKPLDFDEFAKVVRSIGDFWFTVVKLPPHKQGKAADSETA
jgi:two-component system response regulator